MEESLTRQGSYFLDGRAASTYANIARVYGQHDRGFAPLPIFGKSVTSAASHECKEKPKECVEKVERLSRE